MRYLWIACCLLLVLSGAASAAPSSAPKMRPYTGIGILLVTINEPDQSDPLYLYDEPALSRRDLLNLSAIPPYEWIFGTGTTTLPLIVTARKGAWLRVAYDDAGREAWLNPGRRHVHHSWNQFFKLHVSRMLPGLQKRHYQLYQQPGNTVLATLSVSQVFKVVRLENDWAQIVPDLTMMGWVRWRDEDGRLLMGIVTPLPELQP